MKILFITSHVHLPQLRGGLQNSTDQLCRALIKRGHKVSLLAGLTHDGTFGRKSRLRLHLNRVTGHGKLSHDTILGYTVWRTWFPWQEARRVALKEKPDIIVIKSGDIVRVASELESTGIPVAVQLHDVEFHMHSGDFKQLGNITCIANSQFTARKYHKAFGIQPYVIPPFISAEKYVTATTRENVTFINPHPQKGVDIALKVAYLCPEIPFSFIEGWPLKEEDRDKLYSDLKKARNVTLHAATDDMRSIYSKCKILLVPSRWEEAYGRVVSEAQINSIPVVASNRGGLPEAVGSGGIVLNPDEPPEHWAAAVKRLWNDPTYYAKLSAEAYSHAHRPALAPLNQVRMFEDIFADVAQAA